MNASPTKRRVLGALDVNACSPKPKARYDGKLLSALSPVKYTKPVAPRQPEPSRVSPSRTPERDAESKRRRSPSLALASATSRVDETDRGEPAPKRLCLDDHEMGGSGAPRRAESRGEVCLASFPSTAILWTCVLTRASAVPALILIDHQNHHLPPPLCLSRHPLCVRHLGSRQLAGHNPHRARCLSPRRGPGTGANHRRAPSSSAPEDDT